jgi:mannosyltransferase OCH1-like enzyme
MSILSCYATNVLNTNNKIIFWTQELNNQNYEFLKNYCEIKIFNHQEEKNGTLFENFDISVTNINRMSSLFSDYFRYMILSKYGGLYFDLDIFFFKNINYLINTYENFIYPWGYSNFPNNALISIKDTKIMNQIINIFLKYGGSTLCFQDIFGERGENQNYFNFDSPVDINILPCGWFDPMWIDKEDFTKWFENNDNEYFYDDIYCYHWHNRNYLNIEVNSPFYRNIKKVLEKLNLEKIIEI